MRHPGPRRRAVLAAAGASAAALGLGGALGSRGASGSPGVPAPAAPSPAVARTGPGPGPSAAPPRGGTTLTSVSVPDGDGPYRRLTDGAPWRPVVRTELARAGSARIRRRTPLAGFVQFTDLHLVDVQHPLRYEFLRTQTQSAWRPQEALSTAGAVALVERVNALPGGPVTGMPLSFVITTGDNTDNNAQAELEWFLTAMSGGRITPDTGAPGTYEGVQNSGLRTYWQPDSALRDTDKARGFPRIEGFLQAALRSVTSPGLALPWYATVGNHDALPGGCFAASGGPHGFLADFAVGDRKLMELPDADGARMWRAVRKGLDPKGADFAELLRTQRRRMRTVTPDPARAPVTAEAYLRALRNPRWRGSGPLGHGYTERQLETGELYYAFRVADGVMGYSLDTTRRDGHYAGRISQRQLRWLERQLERHRDAYALVFSHHTSTTTPEGGDQLLDLLKRTPHAVAWINGHSHRNRITPHGTLWEVSTASHIDFPQLARVIELVDNRDGTLSLLTTLIEASAPARVERSDVSQTGLASLYRELAANAPGRRMDLAGEAGDRNAELVLRKP
ncbi:TIGR03767 family metallophosphoesterase [Streptomyces boncukensis]|uniref:TIGR03767 family metallophosphoesterase n=1 Tax=Streptomyces boncukensis TaxID=2711219 RepID=A0A6G4X3T9_9ACTN|nr:TIGR03767 family metallophosphoesterase [Streptomyces boncukensis]